MADFLRGVSNFFGLAPSDDLDAYDRDHIDEYDRRDSVERDRDRYAHDEREDRMRVAGRRRYELEDQDELHDERREPYSPHLRPAEPPTAPEHVFIKPESDFQDRYSKAPEIGRHFRDGDIVTFDLSELEPAQQKRYVDFAAGLAFALCGRIIPDGSVITLLPNGVEAADAQRNRMSV